MIVLTFDTDYVYPKDLERFTHHFGLPGRTTFFLWRPFRGLDLGRHELAPHPFLSETTPWRTTLDEFEQAWGRRARVLRAHSCVYSHMLGIELARRGYAAVSQATFLGQANLRPYRHPWGIWELPIYYMDSMDMTFGRNWSDFDHALFSSATIETALADSAGLYVFDFHPIHVILNTSSYDQYQSVRGRVVDERVSPFDLAFAGQGCRTFFEELLRRMNETRQESKSCGDVLDRLQQPPRANI